MSTSIEVSAQSVIPLNSIIDLQIPDTEADITEFVKRTDSAQREGVLITRWKQGEAINKLTGILNESGNSISLFDVCNKAAKTTDVQQRTLLYAARLNEHHPDGETILRYSRAGLSWTMFIETIFIVYSDATRKAEFLQMLEDVIESEGKIDSATVRDLAGIVMQKSVIAPESESENTSGGPSKEELPPSQKALQVVGKLADQYAALATKYEREMEQYQASIEEVFDPAMSDESHEARCRDAATIVMSMKRLVVSLANMLAITAVTSHSGRKTAAACARETVLALTRCGVEPMIVEDAKGNLAVRYVIDGAEEDSTNFDTP